VGTIGEEATTGRTLVKDTGRRSDHGAIALKHWEKKRPWSDRRHRSAMHLEHRRCHGGLFGKVEKKPASIFTLRNGAPVEDGSFE
jgi:hypothetical protein